MKNRINRDELNTLIAKDSGLTKRDADIFIDSFMNVVTNAMLEDKEVYLKGFGKFDVRVRKERRGTHPVTNKPIVIPKARIPEFKVSDSLKTLINGGTDHE